MSTMTSDVDVSAKICNMSTNQRRRQGSGASTRVFQLMGSMKLLTPSPIVLVVSHARSTNVGSRAMHAFHSAHCALRIGARCVGDLERSASSSACARQPMTKKGAGAHRGTAHRRAV